MRQLSRFIGYFVAAVFCATLPIPVAHGQTVELQTDTGITILDGTSLDFGTFVSIQAIPSVTVGSVYFETLDSTANVIDTQTENQAPYYINGDTSGVPARWLLPADGAYTIRVTLYGGSNRSGSVLLTTNTSITAANTGSTSPTQPPQPTSTPAPTNIGDSWLHPSLEACLPSPQSNGAAQIQGELKKWHKISLTFAGPQASETADTFLNNRLDVQFTHPVTGKVYLVPGHFAADGNAANTSATSGNTWRAHFVPDETGTWEYVASFRTGPNVSTDLNPCAGSPDTNISGTNGSFTVDPTDKRGRDMRAKGRLAYVGNRYLQHQETGEYFVKGGADAPENFLAYADFDGGFASDGVKDNLVKTWSPHVADWTSADPTWQGGKGKGIIGAINYLASEDVNVFSFLTLNWINGDDRNVYPYATDNPSESTKDAAARVFDVSKLDQWDIVFDHGTQQGMYLHFKLQETEIDGNPITGALDDGELDSTRKLYYRELVSRFGHNLALNWNLSEEFNPSGHAEKIRAYADYIRRVDPYNHHIVFHTYPGSLSFYDAHHGDINSVTGPSIQTGWNNVHSATLNQVNKSANAGFPWVVANDEQGGANTGVPPDVGYAGFGGTTPSADQIRHEVLWGNLMAGGAGVEYYFGYQVPCTDLNCQDYRSRDAQWDSVRHALHFFQARYVPFWEMVPDDGSVSYVPAYEEEPNPSNQIFETPYAMKLSTNTAYLVYIPFADVLNRIDYTVNIADLPQGAYSVSWYNPRSGGGLLQTNKPTLAGGQDTNTGGPPSSPGEDWVLIVKEASEPTTYPAPDVIDAYYMYQQAGPPPEHNPSDLDGDGDVDFVDYFAMIQDFFRFSIFDFTELVSQFGG